MYGLPKNTALDFLIASELEQIAIGQFQTQLVLTNNVTLSIEGVLELDGPGITPAIWHVKDTATIPELGKFLGSPIVAYEVPGDGRLVLRFAHGGVIAVHDSNREHESYQLTGGGRTLVV